MSKLDKLARQCSAHNLEVFRITGREAQQNRAEALKEYRAYVAGLPMNSGYYGVVWSFEDWCANHGYHLMRAGWFWWSCCPGCMPDGDAMGPFSSATRAAEDALDGFEDEDAED